MPKVPGIDKGGQAVWQLPDGSIVPLAVILDSNGNVFSNPVRTNMEGGGKISVGTTAVEVTFSGTTTAIIITADIFNAGILYVGKSNVNSSGANALTLLEAGEPVAIEYEDGDNPVYVVASIANQNFFQGALL